MYSFIKYCKFAFTTDGKLRQLLNSEHGSSQGKLQRNQQLHDLAKFFNCEVGGIPLLPQFAHNGIWASGYRMNSWSDHT